MAGERWVGWATRVRTGTKRLLACQSGSALMQFAFVCPAFIALLVASLETSLAFFVQEELETQGEVSTRSVITGQAQSADQTGGAQGMSTAALQARFKQNACAGLPSFLSCSNLYVDVRSASDWGSLDTSMPTIVVDKNGNVTNQFSYSLGNSGSIVMVRLMYLWPVNPAPLGFDISNGTPGKRMMVATSVAKIEDYGA